jgi:uncharacterized protein (DUF2267 family)
MSWTTTWRRTPTTTSRTADDFFIVVILTGNTDRPSAKKLLAQRVLRQLIESGDGRA